MVVTALRSLSTLSSLELQFSIQHLNKLLGWLLVPHTKTFWILEFILSGKGLRNVPSSQTTGKKINTYLYIFMAKHVYLPHLEYGLCLKKKLMEVGTHWEGGVYSRRAS